MENLIIKAREFVERVLSNDKNKVGKEHYYMFLISKFLLLKESMIKKDAKNNILYFDYKKNKKYIPSIKYIVDYVKEHGEILQNSTKVVIKNNKGKEDLDSYIWIFNKIRDSFAHGMYSFDLDNGKIIIDNDHSNELNPYLLKCSLPIEMLEFFTYYVENNNQIRNIDYEKEYQEYIERIRSDFSVSSNYKMDIVKDYTNYISNNDYFYDLCKIDYFERKDFIQKTGFNKMFFNNENLKLMNNYDYKNYESIFETLMILLENSKDLTELEKKELLKYLESLGLIDKKKTVKKKRKKDKKYVDKLVCVIEEMSNILGLKGDSKNILAIPALYNYMQLSFSFIDTKNMDSSSLGYLKLSKLNPNYVKMEENEFGERGFSLNETSPYSLKCNAIEKECKTFISYMNERIKLYDNKGLMEIRHSLMDRFTKFYSEMILELGDRNEYIVSSLRNSVEHANINEFNGYIILNDKTNQDDNKTINFSCYAKPKDLYEVTKSIEMGTSKEEFTIGDFLEEIKYTISADVYNELLVTLQKMSNIIFGKDLALDYKMEKMYIEAVTNVINSSIQKR